jgi:NAD dependent epimerase/dehydratase family enzyme
LRRVFNARLGSRLGDGKQWVPWIHLDDEVGIILEAVENPAYNGPVNLMAPNPVTNAELTTEIASTLKKSTFLPVPSLALKLVMGEASSMVLTSLRAKPEVALANGYTFKHPELRGALASLV